MITALLIYGMLSASSCVAAEWGDEGPLDSGVEIPSGYTSITDYEKYKKGEDWSPAFAEAFKRSDLIYIPPGTYHSNIIKVPSGKTVYGAGSSTIIIPLTYKLFAVEGSMGPEISINTDITDFSNTITLSQAGQIFVGEDILIKSQRNCMVREGIEGVNYDKEWVLGRTKESSCFFAEFDVVASVAGSTITTQNNRIFPSYFADNSREPQLPAEFLVRPSTTVRRMDMVKNVTLRNFSVRGTDKCTVIFNLAYCKDILVEDITFNSSVEPFNSAGRATLGIVNGTHALRAVVRRCKSLFSPALVAIINDKPKEYVNFSNYNLFRMIGCTESGFEDCSANCGSHSFGITRGVLASTGGGIPSVNCFIRNCVSTGSIWSGVSVQQACYGTKLIGNIVNGSGQGIFTAGRNTLIENNTLTCSLPYNTSFYYTHIYRGGTIGVGMNEGYACGSIVRGNTIRGYYTGIELVDGYEDKNCSEEGDILVEDNTVTDCLRGFAFYKNNHNLTLGRKDVNIEVRNNEFTRTGAWMVAVGSSLTSTNGIYLPLYTQGVNIHDNIIRNYNYGVWMDEFVDYIQVKNNRFEGVNCGIGLAQMDNNPQNLKINLSQSGNTFNTSTQSSGLDQAFVQFY